jgi:hypothetical protein
LGIVESHPWGAPCGAGTLPGHGFQSQVAPPFVLELSKDCYLPGEKIRVDLKGEIFHGFVIQSRSPPGTRRRGLGQFLQNSPQNALWKFNCGNGRYSLTHNSSVPKKEIQLEWQSLQDVGDVEFVATTFYSPQGTSFGSYWHEGAKAILQACELPEPVTPAPSQTQSLSAEAKLLATALGNEEKPKLDPKCNQPPPTIPWCDSDRPIWKIRWYHQNETCKTVHWWDANCDVDNGFETQDKCRKACNSIF